MQISFHYYLKDYNKSKVCLYLEDVHVFFCIKNIFYKKFVSSYWALTYVYFSYNFLVSRIVFCSTYFTESTAPLISVRVDRINLIRY